MSDQKPKSGLAKRAFLKWGEINYKMLKGIGKALKDPRTGQAMKGFGDSAMYMATGERSEGRATPVEKQKTIKKGTTKVGEAPSSRKDIHIHIHIDKEELEEE